MRNLFIFIIVALCSSVMALAQSKLRTAGGVVVDQKSGKPMDYIAVYFKNTSSGCVTNYDGEFFVKDSSGADTLVIDAVGYEKVFMKLEPGSNLDMKVALRPASVQLEGVVVKPKKERYKKKDNPAIALIKKVISKVDSNRVVTGEGYKCKLYEKLTLSLDNYTPDLTKKKTQFIKEYIDTSEITGKPILTVSIRETVSDYYHRISPEETKIVKKAFRQTGIDKTFDHNGGLTAGLAHLFTGIDIFGNDVTFMANRFVSPLSPVLAIAYYKYYIMGTVVVDGIKCIDLAFVPYNSQSYGFTGRLYITADGNYSIKKLQLNFPSSSNVNWIDKLRIDQEFCQTEDGRWALKREDSYVNLSVYEGTQGVFVHQARVYDEYKFGLTEQEERILSSDGPVEVMADAKTKTDDYWNANRLAPLERREERVAKVTEDIAKKSSTMVWLRILDAFISEYVPTTDAKETSKFDFGPVLSFIGYNYIEGPRLRIGGMTTANLSKRWFADGYVAYGFADGKVKGGVELTHSFNPKNYHSKENPLNNLSVSYKYDIFSPEALGEQHGIIASLKVGTVKKLQYIRRAGIRYDRQWINSLRTTFKFENIKYTPANRPGTVGDDLFRYNYISSDGAVSCVPDLTTSELSAEVRWAPGEKVYNSVSTKLNFDKDAPIFTLKHSLGIKGLFGSGYDYHRTEFNAFKRFHLSVAGFLDVRASVGKVWNSVPWPLLMIPAANQTFTYRRETFHTMNALEFVTDQYAQINMTWHLKGLILNRIPLIKHLKLREILIFNGIYGGLTDKNNPLLTRGLFSLPFGTYALGQLPYMEVGVGLENIFQLFKVAYFYRLTYRDHNLTWLGKWGGLRFGIYADF